MNDFRGLVDCLKSMKSNDIAIKRYEERREKEILQQRQFFIERTTPKEFLKADIKKIDKRIINFAKGNNLFCWIHGVKGVGKTYSLYAIRNYFIYKGNIYFDIKMEGELNYDIDFRDINAVDNLCMSDSKIKFLSDYYFNLIDWCWKYQKKLYLTSTKDYNFWLDMLSKINLENAEAIASRFSNNIEIIELKGNDKRKIK